MVIQRKTYDSICHTIFSSLRDKFNSYNPEPASMPFHTRLLGRDRLALYQFIHSLNTNFGTTIFEPVAVTLAQGRFKYAERQHSPGNQISTETQHEIQRIIDKLSTAESSPNKTEELKLLRKVCRDGVIQNVRLTKVDLYLESFEDELFLVDIKTAKPNTGEFKGYKRTLLEWAGTKLFTNPNVKVNTLLAIPYNPYEPQQYNRWTMRGMIDLEHELKVAKEFWDFLGGIGAYEDLLDCFEKVGIEMRDEIDDYFSRFK